MPLLKVCTLSDFVQDLFPVQKWQSHQQASSGSFQLGSWKEEEFTKEHQLFPGSCLGTSQAAPVPVAADCSRQHQELQARE